MNPFLLAAGAVVVAGGIACVTSRRAAIVALGAALLLGGSAFLEDPLPVTLLIAERVVGAGLAAELLWIVLRGGTVRGASPLPWPALGLIAAASFAAGLGLQGVVPGVEPAAAVAASVALFVLAITAATGRPDGPQFGLIALLLFAATGIARVALGDPMSSLETLLTAAIGVAIAAATAVLVPPRRGASARPLADGRAAGPAGADTDESAVPTSGGAPRPTTPARPPRPGGDRGPLPPAGVRPPARAGARAPAGDAGPLPHPLPDA